MEDLQAGRNIPGRPLSNEGLWIFKVRFLPPLCGPTAGGFQKSDTFDHDKGQKSAISGRRLHWRLSTGFFAFSPIFMCNLVRRAPQNLEKIAKNPAEKIASNPVTSVAVMVFSALKKSIFF